MTKPAPRPHEPFPRPVSDPPTLWDFQEAYRHICARWLHPPARLIAARVLMGTTYAHIRPVCERWLAQLR